MYGRFGEISVDFGASVEDMKGVVDCREVMYRGCFLSVSGSPLSVQELTSSQSGIILIAHF